MLKWYFYCYSSFTWNQIFRNWNSQKMSFSTILKFWIWIFIKFEQFFMSQIYQNSIFSVSKIVKKTIFEIQILPKLISRKIRWQLDSWTSTLWGLNFTFSKFLEHSAACFDPSIATFSCIFRLFDVKTFRHDDEIERTVAEL